MEPFKQSIKKRVQISHGHFHFFFNLEFTATLHFDAQLHIYVLFHYVLWKLNFLVIVIVFICVDTFFVTTWAQKLFYHHNVC